MGVLDSPWKRAVFWSVALHILFILLLLLQPAPKPTVQSVAPLQVQIQAAPKELKQNKHEKQIVSETQQKPSEIVPKDTRLLSDKNFFTEKQQLKKGDGIDYGPNPGQKSQPSTQRKQTSKITATEPVKNKQKSKREAVEKKTTQQQPSTKQPTRKRLNKLLDLGPATKTLRELEVNAATKPSPRSQTAVGETASEPEPFSRRAGTGARFHGVFGQADYLPDVRDGDITLLNAKANKFAVFVRRVALRVFKQIKGDGWETLRASQVAAINEFALVRAVLSPKGTLLKVQIEGPSGSSAFDLMLKGAVSQSAADPHPPASAVAPDGNIHFIFAARSWVQRYNDPRNPGFGERRWLILKTGLE